MGTTVDEEESYEIVVFTAEFLRFGTGFSLGYVDLALCLGEREAQDVGRVFLVAIDGIELLHMRRISEDEVELVGRAESSILDLLIWMERGRLFRLIYESE